MSVVEIVLPARRRGAEEELGGRRQQQQQQRVRTVLPGESIAAEAGFLRGHGTYLLSGGGSKDEDDDDEPSQQQQQVLVSAVSGVVERVSKLVCVRPLRARYAPEVGDVVVGRVREVGQSRWRVDVRGRCDATLQLSAVNLPGGVQRKRTHEDELNMRRYLQEGDLLSAEVQAVGHDGLPALHTRSTRYGKLRQGVLVAVPAALVKRCKSHFHACDFGVSFVLGVNGFVWVYPSSLDVAAVSTPGEEDKAGTQQQQQQQQTSLPAVPAEVRSRMARVRNSFAVLAMHGVMVSPATVLAAYSASERAGVPVPDMLRPSVSVMVAANAREASTIA